MFFDLEINFTKIRGDYTEISPYLLELVVYFNSTVTCCSIWNWVTLISLILGSLQSTPKKSCRNPDPVLRVLFTTKLPRVFSEFLQYFNTENLADLVRLISRRDFSKDLCPSCVSNYVQKFHFRLFGWDFVS